MTETPRIVAGVDRSHGRSTAQKTAFTQIQPPLAICAHIALETSIPLPGWPGDWQALDPLRAKIVLAVTAPYTLRLSITLFYLQRRLFGWTESLALGANAGFETGSCLLAAG